MKRSIMGLIYVIQGMQKAGLELTSSLENIGIYLDKIDPEVLIERDLELKIRQHLSQNCDAILGIKVGQQYSLSGYGPYLMLLMTAKDIETILNEAINFQDLTYLFGTLSWQFDHRDVRLCYQPLANQQHNFMTQVEIAGTYKFLQDMYHLLGLANIKISVTLPFDLPIAHKDLNIYQQYYGADVEFGAPYAMFCCDRSLLDVSLNTADKVMHEVYKKRCLEELKRLNHQSMMQVSMPDKIRNYLYLQYYQMPSLQEISHVFAIPERSLRHQLNQLGTSFQSIKEDVLKQRAIDLLQEKRYSIEHIALVLGYAETASFNHAFKRWFGVSPKNYLI